MTNKQWLMWKMIDMRPYELGQVLRGRCDNCVARFFCKKEFPPGTAKPQCHHIITKWLQQEHKECGEDAGSSMEVVAALFGKQLGEDFFVKHPKQTEPFLAQFEDNGVWYICSYDGSAEWHYSETLLVQLLTGEAVIVDDK